MATVFIPTQLRKLTGGTAQVVVSGRTVREIVLGLEQQFPGFQSRLCTDGRLASHLQVTVDNQLSQRGLLAQVGPHSEVHFLPAIGGG
jgi:sulfur-carrier protein